MVLLLAQVQQKMSELGLLLEAVFNIKNAKQ